MQTLNNPYLTYDSQNLLLKKNYNVIQSSTKETLYPRYQPSRGKHHQINNDYNHSHKYESNNKNHQSLTTYASTSNLLRNPFGISKALVQRNQNYQQSYSNLPSFYTQQYFHQQHLNKKQLPFPSYNRPQSSNRSISSSSLSKVNNILSLSRRNLAISGNENRMNVKITSMQSLQKVSNNGVYRPHFVSPTSRNNINSQWNTQRWRKQLYQQQIKKVQKYGSQAFRYDGLLLKGGNSYNNNNGLNNEYYSTSSLQRQMIYKINVQKPSQQIKKNKKSMLLFFQSQQYQNQQTKTNKNNNHKKYHPEKNNNKQSSQSSSNSLFVSAKDPDGYHHNNREYKQVNIKQFSDIRQQSEIYNIQSKIEQFNHNHNHYLNVKNNNFMQRKNNSQQYQDDDNEDRFMSKYQSKYQQKNNNGPLDIDNVFDSIRPYEDNNKEVDNSFFKDIQRQSIHDEQKNNNQKKEQQQQYMNKFGSETFGAKKIIKYNKNYQQNRQSSINNYNINYNISNNKLNQQQNQNINNINRKKISIIRKKQKVQNTLNNIASKDYPQKIQYKNKTFYRLKLTEDKK